MGPEEDREAPAENARRARAFDAVALGLAFAALAVAYVPLLDNSLVFDDTYLVAGAEGLGDPGALGGMLLSPFWKNSSATVELLHDYWRPVTTFALWLTAFLAGKAPWAFHLLSLVGLLASTAALCALLARFSKERNRSAALPLALLYAAHPLAAEILGMAANVSDHLALTFLILEILALARHVERGKIRHLMAATAFGALACGSKEIGLVSAFAPVAAALLVRASGHAEKKSALLSWGRLAASLAPVAAYLALRALVSSRAGWIETAWPSRSSFALSLALGPGLALRSIAAPSPTGAYLYLSGAELAPWIFAVLAWALIAFAALRPLVKKKPFDLPALGALTALALLLPSLLGVERLPDEDVLRFPTRYFHLPLTGLLVAALPAATKLWERGLKQVLPLAVALLAALSWMRTDEWQDEVSFFAAEAAYHPASLLDQLNYVRALSHTRAFAATEAAIARTKAFQGADAPRIRARLMNDEAALLVLRDGDLDGAIRVFEQAIALAPADLSNILDLSSALMAAHRKEEALALLAGALESPYFRDYRRAEIEKRIRKYEAL